MQSVQHLFVLSTGRSGTKTCAQLLSSFQGCRIEHQLRPTLLDEVTDYLSGSMPHQDMVALLRKTRGPECFNGETVIGESNQRLAYALPALAEAFPSAKYLWVIRDGRDVVASMHHRLWYHPREAQRRHPELAEWAANRIHADWIGEMPTAQWARLDSFARCCWYWAHTNRMIAEGSRKLNLRIRCVRLEQLHEQLPDVLEFLELDADVPSTIPCVNRSFLPKRVGWWRNPTPHVRWSGSQRRIFAMLGADVMDEHYPEWSSRPRQSLSGELTSTIYRSAKVICTGLASLSRPVRTHTASLLHKTPSAQLPGAASR